MITDKALNDILNADEYSLRHHSSDIYEAIEELQMYRKPIYSKCTIGCDEVLFLMQCGKVTQYNIFKGGIWREVK